MVSGTTASQSGTHDGPRASWIKEHRRRATCLDRARRRSAAGRDVQLYLTQQESAAGASAAADSIHRGSGFRSTVTAIQQALRTRRSTVDRSREAAAGLVAAVAVLSAKRAAADGATGLQPAVPLVCGAEHG